MRIPAPDKEDTSICMSYGMAAKGAPPWRSRKPSDPSLFPFSMLEGFTSIVTIPLPCSTFRNHTSQSWSEMAVNTR